MGKMRTLALATAPEEFGIDFQGPFTLTKYAGEVCDYLFSLIDISTGEVIAIPTQKDGLTAHKCADLYMREAYPRWGLPLKMRSDRNEDSTLSFGKTSSPI